MLKSPEKAALFIVDDDANIRYLIEAAAARAGVFDPITSFDDGATALEALQRLNPAAYPQLIVTDLSMPRMTGIELLRALKADQTMRDIPVAIVTSSDLPHERAHALQAGACAFVPKPYGLDTLMLLLTELWSSCGAKAQPTGTY